jgi:hypothetical protein
MFRRDGTTEPTTRSQSRPESENGAEPSTYGLVRCESEGDEEPFITMDVASLETLSGVKIAAGGPSCHCAGGQGS